MPDLDGMDYERRLCARFAAALFRASAADVVRAAIVIHPADVETLDSPTAALFGVAVGLAQRGVDPGPVEVHGAIMRAGLYRDHTGELLRHRVIDATAGTGPVYPEQLSEMAAGLLATIFRNRVTAAGAALSALAVDAPESDCWQTLQDQGAALRKLWDRLSAVRVEVAA